MLSSVFPLRELTSRSIDGAFGSLPSGRRSVLVSDSLPNEPVRSTVLSRGKRFSTVSFPSDPGMRSSLSVAFGEQPLVFFGGKSVDSLHRRDRLVGEALPSRAISLADQIRELDRYYRAFSENVAQGISGFQSGISSGRVAYAPLLGAMVLGMGSAFFLQHTFGSRVEAEEARIVYVERSDGLVLGESDEYIGTEETEALISELLAEDPDKKEFEKRLRNMVAGYPIEKMIPSIIEQDRTVAMFLVAIAKKESNWGKRVPVLEGQDCFNYWGYRGIRKMMGTGGHTCFNSREDAVETVSARLAKLIHENKLDTPEKLILWKCGYSCAGHSSYSVRKWISDVDLYYQKLNGNGA